MPVRVSDCVSVRPDVSPVFGVIAKFVAAEGAVTLRIQDSDTTGPVPVLPAKSRKVAPLTVMA